jgi:hypothetical protein
MVCTFVKAVQPTPMMNTRSLSATIVRECNERVLTYINGTIYSSGHVFELAQSHVTHRLVHIVTLRGTLANQVSQRERPLNPPCHLRPR